MRIFLSAMAFLMASLLAPSLSVAKSIDGKNVSQVKVWNTKNGKRASLDELSTYDASGNKIEEVDYDAAGDQKSRVSFSYNEKGKCVEEKHFDKFNKLEKTVQFQYNEHGKKSLETVLLPSGKVKKVKEYEYVVAQ